MAVIVIDVFSGDCKFHGENVVDIIKKYYNGNIIKIDTGSCTLSWKDVYQILENTLDKIKSGEYKNIVAINMSYGGGETSTPKYWNLYPEWYDLWKDYFDNNIALCFPSGNISKGETINWDGVSLLASSPYVVATSAIENQCDKISDDYDRWIAWYAEYEHSIIDHFASGYAIDFSIGTSYSSPKTCAIYANLMEKGFSIPEIETAYRITSEPIKGHNNDWYWTIDIEEMLNLYKPIDVNNPEVIVWNLYYLVCGRQPDPDGLEFWTNMFEFYNFNIEQAIELFINGAIANGDIRQNDVPIRSKIEAFYEFFFGREPDMQGLSHWINIALHSQTWDEVLKQIWIGGIINEENIQHEQFIDEILNCNDNIFIEALQEYDFQKDYFYIC